MSLDIGEEVLDVKLRESGLRDFALLKLLGPYMKPHWMGLVLSIVLLPLATVLGMAQPFIIRQAIDGPIRHGDFVGLWQLVSVFVILLIGTYLVRYLQTSVSQITGQRIIFDLRTALYAHLQTLSPSFYQKHPIGKLVTRISSDVENLSEMFSSGGIAIIGDIAIIAGSVIGMFLMNSELALYTCLMLPVLIGTMEFFRRKSRNAYEEIRINVAHMNAFLQENISGMEIVQLYQREEKNLRDFKALNDENLAHNLSSVFYDSSMTAVIEFLTNITLIMVLWLGGQAITHGHMTFGLLVAFFQYVQMMFNPIEDVSDKYTIIQSGLASIDKIMALFREKNTLQNALGTHRIANLRGEVVFEQVDFGYLPEQTLIQNLSFHIKPGQTIAIVGPSGAGKTTLIKLLTRFYDVTSGHILLDGQDIRELDPQDLRRQIVVIQQDDILFSRSIAENITLEPEPPQPGTPEYHRLIESIHQVQADKVISRMPQGILEPLLERGRNLSSGEKQLILFARAFYHNPPILVLDEATSAIDSHTEHLVQQAMEKLMEDRTVIVIAHRLSTIQQADNILVMEEGQLKESGTHPELLAKNGLYTSFHHYQQVLQEAGL